jgi:hypothetical protein
LAGRDDFATTEEEVESPGKSTGGWYITDTRSSILAPLINRISVDGCMLDMGHVVLGSNGLTIEERKNSLLNQRLTDVANMDQTGRALIKHALEIMMEEGSVALVPVETTRMIDTAVERAGVVSLRAAKIVTWYPSKVKVSIYNENVGRQVEKILPKEHVAIAYNPMYMVLNDPNGTLQRLVKKLALLDISDEKISAGKLDIIVQLPFAVKGDRLAQEAARRKKRIESQLEDSRYGVAYIDGVERVTQLNRPATNNLLEQIEMLTSMLYGQLGITQGVFTGDTEPQALAHYYSRSVYPMMTAICEAITTKFLSENC